MKSILLFLFTLNYLFGHNIYHIVSHEESITVTFALAKKGEFSFQSYEIYAPQKEVPFQVGRTDVYSRVIFVPDNSGEWKIKLFSEDGHGKIITINVDKNIKKQEKLKNDSLFTRYALWLFLLLLIFGTLYFIKKERK